MLIKLCHFEELLEKTQGSHRKSIKNNFGLLDFVPRLYVFNCQRCQLLGLRQLRTFGSIPYFGRENPSQTVSGFLIVHAAAARWMKDITFPDLQFRSCIPG